MSGAMENRAAVFSSSSQDVEVYQAGAWWPGSLLGWRHEADGSCQVWVRVAVAGVERTAWTDLAVVRLPERPTLHSVPPAGAGDLERNALTSTMSLFAVRNGTPEGPGGPATVAGGPRPGGRRRAPEAPDAPAWGAAAREGLPGGGGGASSGRHRAPASGGAAAGRHRADDTGVLPAVPADEDVPRRASVPARPHRSAGAWAAVPETPGRALPVVPEPGGAPDDAAFHTRPLRLATSVPRPRSPHRDA